MSPTILVVLLVCAAACAHTHGHRHTTANTSVKTMDPPAPVTVSPSGEFLGSWMKTRRGRSFQAYRGIKYAEPPTGKLRFQSPVPILHYKKQVDASQEGPACPLPAPDDYYVSEDCLTINVYTPGKNSGSKPLPVIFFIHPGGFYAMTGRSDLAGPHYLLDRDVVLVTINYRLATLGFLATGDDFAPGNYAMKDQVVALKWVQRNLASFGGDPNLVTITGCSAGAISVMLHMVSPMSKGLFHRAISLSGSPVNKEPLPTKQLETAKFQAEILKCPTGSSREIYDCLKTKPWKELGNSLNDFNKRYMQNKPVQFWWPVVEPDYGQERFLTMDPLDAIHQGKMHAVPYIISKTTEEFSYAAYTILGNETLMHQMDNEWTQAAQIQFLLPKEDIEEKSNRIRQFYLKGQPLRNDLTTLEGLKQVYADSIIGFSAHRLANLMCKYSLHPVYYGEFAYFGNHSHYEDPVTKKPVGAAHHDDLIYLFTLSYRFPTIEVSDSEDSKMVDRMTALWYNFARYGDPNPRGDTPELGTMCWPVMTCANNKYLRLGDQFTEHTDMLKDRYAFWDQLYPITY